MFKVEHVTVDIDLDFSEFEKIPEKDKLLKPIREPSGQGTLDWTFKVVGESIDGKTKEQILEIIKGRFSNDPVKATFFLAENIDFWYGKGVEWWMENLKVAEITSVFNHIVGQVFKVKKK